MNIIGPQPVLNSLDCLVTVPYQILGEFKFMYNFMHIITETCVNNKGENVLVMIEE